jgi:hypothetical protein
MITFEEHVAACEYMGEINPKMCAWVEGPRMGLIRFEYVEAHKDHQKAIECGDSDKIDAAWEAYCRAQNRWVDAYYK